MDTAAQARDLYAAALELSAREVEDASASLDELVEACIEEGVTPWEVVRMHGELSRAASRALLGPELRLLERVVAGVQTDTHQVAHDLRNSIQVITGSLSLLERDLRCTGGKRTSELLKRTQQHLAELAARIERMEAGRSDLG